MPEYYFDHVHIISPDPQKTAEFYEKMLGAKKCGDRKLPDGRINVDIDLKGTAIKVAEPRAKPLLPTASSTRYGVEHWGLRTDNIEAAVSELQAKGVKFVQDITQIPGVKIAFFVTPDEELVELLERTSPTR